ncbi:hypothetical protein D3C80_2060150 [compost metagenome]
MGVLPHPAQLLAPVNRSQLAQFDTVDQQRAPVGQEAQKQVQQRAFPGTAKPDQGNTLIGWQGKIKRPCKHYAIG